MTKRYGAGDVDDRNDIRCTRSHSPAAVRQLLCRTYAAAFAATLAPPLQFCILHAVKAVWCGVGDTTVAAMIMYVGVGDDGYSELICMALFTPKL